MSEKTTGIPESSSIFYPKKESIRSGFTAYILAVIRNTGKKSKSVKIRNSIYAKILILRNNLET